MPFVCSPHTQLSYLFQRISLDFLLKANHNLNEKYISWYLWGNFTTENPVLALISPWCPFWRVHIHNQVAYLTYTLRELKFCTIIFAWNYFSCILTIGLRCTSLYFCSRFVVCNLSSLLETIKLNSSYEILSKTAKKHKFFEKKRPCAKNSSARI